MWQGTYWTLNVASWVGHVAGKYGLYWLKFKSVVGDPSRWHLIQVNIFLTLGTIICYFDDDVGGFVDDYKNK